MAGPIAQSMTLIKIAPKLGELLLKHTSLTAEQLDEALKIQEKEGGLLGEILVRKNMIPPTRSCARSAFRSACPSSRISSPTTSTRSSSRDIPINYAKTKEVLPIAQGADLQGESPRRRGLRSVQRSRHRRSASPDRPADPPRRQHQHAHPGRHQPRLRAQHRQPRREDRRRVRGDTTISKARSTSSKPPKTTLPSSSS